MRIWHELTKYARPCPISLRGSGKLAANAIRIGFLSGCKRQTRFETGHRRSDFVRSMEISCDIKSRESNFNVTRALQSVDRVMRSRRYAITRGRGGHFHSEAIRTPARLIHPEITSRRFLPFPTTGNRATSYRLARMAGKSVACRLQNAPFVFTRQRVDVTDVLSALSYDGLRPTFGPSVTSYQVGVVPRIRNDCLSSVGDKRRALTFFSSLARVLSHDAFSRNHFSPLHARTRTTCTYIYIYTHTLRFIFKYIF